MDQALRRLNPFIQALHHPQHSTPVSPTNAYLLQINAHQADRVRDTCAALQLVPHDIRASLTGLQATALSLAQQPHAVAVVDLGLLPEDLPTVTELARMLKAGPRARVFLTRVEQGPVWPSDRHWIRALGFADLLTEWGTGAAPGEASDPLARMAVLAHVDMATTTCDPLARDSQRDSLKLAADSDLTTPRGLVRQLTGLCAEDLSLALASNVKSVSRLHKFKVYPACKRATEMVSWMAGHYKLERAQAVALGAALQALGLLHHVQHAKAFADRELFFRMNCTTHSIEPPPSQWLHRLQRGAAELVSNRRYRGTTYPQCFVGEQAVDWLTEHHQVNRPDAENALNRLHQYRLIEHVTGDHPARDGYFFYRFGAYV